MLIGNVVEDEIADLDLHSGFKIWVLLHFLIDERDRFGGNVAAVVVEALKLMQEGEESVSNSTT
jgi:hypothetical protein